MENLHQDNVSLVLGLAISVYHFRISHHKPQEIQLHIHIFFKLTFSITCNSSHFRISHTQKKKKTPLVHGSAQSSKELLKGEIRKDLESN